MEVQFMPEKELNSEEQRLKVRRRLLKLAVYSIPVISTILTSKDAYSDGEESQTDLTDEYYDELEDDADKAAGEGEKTRRRRPNGPKKHKTGLS